MRTVIVSWSAARTPRERAVLTAAALLLFAIFTWVAVIVPFGNAMASARVRYETAVTALGKARAEAAMRRPAARAEAARPLPAPVGALLQQAALEAGFTEARVMQAGAGRASVAIAAARPEAAFAWLKRIEDRGLRLAALTATENEDRTIRVEATFEGPVR